MKALNLLVAGSFAFPFGTGEAGRVRLLALALKENGANIKALNLVCTETRDNAINVKPRGTYRGIDFEYATGTTFQPKFFIPLRLLQIKGLCAGLFRFVKLHFRQPLGCVLLYGCRSRVAVPVILLCRLLGIPVILEVSEWWPVMPLYSEIERKIFLKFTLRKVDGFIVISENISKAIADLGFYKKRKIPIIKVPILVDNKEWENHGGKRAAVSYKDDYILWCGDMVNYIEEVKFLIKVMSELFVRKADIKLKLVGKTTLEAIKELKDYQYSLGVPADNIIYGGTVSQGELVKQYAGAFALLMPMRSNKQNLFRFPNKLGEYLATGRPVISSNIGEIANFLNNGVNAILCRPECVTDFASSVEILLKSPEHAQQIGEAGRELSRKAFDYGSHGARMMDFIRDEILIKKNRFS